MGNQFAAIWQAISGSSIMGTKANGEVIPVKVKDDGSLDVGLTFNGDITLGTVGIDQATPHANEVAVKSSALPAGAATQATLASILANLASPATSGKQDTIISSLASILGKLIGAPSTEAKQDTAITKLTSIDGKVATQSTLASILATLGAGVALESTLSAINAKLTAMNSGATVIASGSLVNTPVSPSRASSAVYEASHVAKATGGRLFSISGHNSGPSQWIQIHDASSLPANSAVPIAIFAVPSQSSFSFDFGGVGLPCSTGITITNSSTGPTKTIGSADCFLTAVYL